MDIIFDLVKNIFNNPPEKSNRIQIKNLQAEIDKSLTLQWEMNKYVLTQDQEHFIKKIAGFLQNNTQATILVYPKTYANKEREQILFFEAKKSYFTSNIHKTTKSFSAEDVEIVDKMSVKDPLFAHYMKMKVSDSMIFTLQERCSRLIGVDVINTRYENLKKEREKAFMKYFTEKRVEKQVKFAANENIIPFNGFSFYKIEYHGKFPKFLIKSKGEMKDLKMESNQ